MPSAIDAAVPDATAHHSTRGEACGREGPTCAADLMCLPLPHGSCGSFCGLAGTACAQGACVETWRAGEVCLASCTQDADCRTADGYVCDRAWHACVQPGMTALVPRSCPASGGRDGAFAAATQLSTAAGPGLYQFEPTGIVNDDGGITAMYLTRGKITDGNPLGVARIDGRGKPSIDGVFSSGRGSHFDPWVARDKHGTIYAVWLGFDGRGEHQEIGFASSTDHGVTWSASVPVHDPADCKEGEEDCLDKPMIAIGPDPVNPQREIVYLTYAGGGEEGGLRVRASRDLGKTWSSPVTPLEGIYGNLVVSRDGHLHLVSLHGGPMGAYGSTDHKVEYVTSADGGKTFTKPQVVSAPGESLPFFFSNPSIAVDDRRGWIYLAYVRGGSDGLWDLVITASRDHGKTWTRTRLGDDPACAIHMVPNLALDPTTGTLHVAWYDSTGTGRFAHATCAIGAARCTVGGAINSLPFAALSTERHGSKWVGEYETLLVDDKRRVLHAIWAQPVVEGATVVTRIFHAAASLPGH